MRRFWLVSALIASLAAPPALASQPDVWVYAEDKDFRTGTLDGLTLHPSLGLSAAPALTRQGLDAEFVHCWLRDGNKLWLGTGLQGKVFVLEGGKARLVASVDAPFVASLLPDGQGGVYAGLVGSGQIAQISADGKVTPLAKLADAEHVWSLARIGNTLYAGTGPTGEIHAVDLATRSSRRYAETNTEHVLVLQADGNSLIAGTAESALLLRIDGPDKVRAIAAFPGAEVRSLTRSGKTWYAAVNGGATAAPLAGLKGTPERPGAEKAKPGAQRKAGKNAESKGQGAVWRVGEDGVVSRAFVSPEGMISEIGVVGRSIVAGSARGGRLVLGDDFGDVQVLFDLDEEEVLGLEVGPKGPLTLLTGKSAAVYTVGSVPATAVFTTGVLAESAMARWGRVEASAEGPVLIETRSGFTPEANNSWTPWVAAQGGQIQSPAATHLQVRVTLQQPTSRLQELRIFRQVINRPPVISSVDAKVQKGKGNVSLQWNAEDPDGDQLAFVVQYRQRGSKQWLFLHDRYYDKKQMELNPADMPDGWYEVRVEATDVLANGPREARAVARLSRAFAIDRTRPEVTARVTGMVVNGTVTDATSRIVRVEVSIDGEPPVQASARDGVFDGTTEAFELPLSMPLQGPHTLLVTATDEAGNIGVSRVVVGQ